MLLLPLAGQVGTGHGTQVVCHSEQSSQSEQGGGRQCHPTLFSSLPSLVVVVDSRLSWAQSVLGALVL